MIVNCFGKSFEFVNPIISIGSISFDVRTAEEWVNEGKLTYEGELARLYLNILGWSESTKLIDGKNIIIPARKGVDLATATYDEIWEYLNTTDEKMSESLKELLRKCMKIKDNNKFKQEINLVTAPFKNEYKLIEMENQTIKTLAECAGGKFGQVRLDGTTTIISKRVL